MTRGRTVGVFFGVALVASLALGVQSFWRPGDEDPKVAQVRAPTSDRSVDRDSQSLYDLRQRGEDAAVETYREPKFALPSLQPAQTELQAKLGGLPWGFPVERWPECKGCGHAMSLVAQLPQASGVFEFGDGDPVLHVFHCEFDPGMCNYWDWDEGANACVLVDRSEIGDGLMEAPEQIATIPESWIVEWEKRETPEKYLAQTDVWYDQSKFHQMPEDVLFDNEEPLNKAGGMPMWTGNGPMGFPPAPYEFLAQFDTHLHFDGELPAEDGADFLQIGHMLLRKYCEEKSGYYGTWAKLGSDGTGYLFVDRSVTPVDVVWFWNR